MARCPYCQMESDNATTCVWCRRPIGTMFPTRGRSAVDWLQDNDDGVGVSRGSAIVGFVMGLLFLGVIGFALSLPRGGSAAGGKEKASGRWVAGVKEFAGIYEAGQAIASEPEGTSSVGSAAPPASTVPPQNRAPQGFESDSTPSLRSSGQATRYSLAISAGDYEVEAQRTSVFIESVDLEVLDSGEVKGTIVVVNRNEELVDHLRVAIGTDLGWQELDAGGASLLPRRVTSIDVFGHILDRTILGGKRRMVRISGRIGHVQVGGTFELPANEP